MIEPARALRDRFRRWRERSIQNRLLGATMMVGVLTGVVTLASMAKDIVAAKSFGAGDLLDAYNIALSIPMFVVTVVASPVAAVLVPAYVQARERDAAEAHRLFGNVLAGLAGVLLVLLALLAATAPLTLPRYAAGFPPEKLALTHRLFLLMLPIAFTEGVTATWVAVLNARERFVLGALAPVMTPLVPLVLLLAAPGLGIFALTYGTVTGFALKAVLIGMGLRSHRLPVVPRWTGGPQLRRLALQALSISVGQFFVSALAMVDPSMASSLAPGSVSTLNFGNKLIVPFQSVGSIALGTAVLPYFARLLAQRDRAGLTQAVKSYGRLILVGTVPLTILLVLAGEPLVRLFFQRGAFSADDVRRVAHVQAMYAIQIPFYLLGAVALRLIYALQGNQWLMGIYGLGLVVHVGLNLVLMKPLGAAGLALSYSLTFALYLALYVVAIRVLWRNHAWADAKAESAPPASPSSPASIDA